MSATPARVTRSASRRASAEPEASPASSATTGRRARNSRAASTGLASRSSGAYGGHGKSTSAERMSAEAAGGDLAAGLNAARAETPSPARLTPVREDHELAFGGADPSPAPRSASPNTAPTSPRELAQAYPGANPAEDAASDAGHHSQRSGRVFSFLGALFMILTGMTLMNMLAPMLGLPSLQQAPALDNAPSYAQLRDSLYGDLSKALASTFAQKSPPPIVVKPPEKLDTSAVDHNSLALHYVNHFSLARGAIINPTLTSPTKHVSDEQRETRANAIRALSPFNPAKWASGWLVKERQRTPASVLAPWTEAGECWCAERVRPPPPYYSNGHPAEHHAEEILRDTQWFNTRGGIADPVSISLAGSPNAQLAVLMPAPIYPTHAVIEHVPATGTTDIKAAPEWIEIFAEIDAQVLNNRVWNEYAIEGKEPMAPRPRPEYTWWGMQLWGDEMVSKGVSAWKAWFNLSTFKNVRAFGKLREEYGFSGPLALGREWVRVGRFRYDIHGQDHVQSWKIPVDFKKLGVPVQQMVVRVRSNYGQRYTCMYRVRMMGELVDQGIEEPKPVWQGLKE